MSPDHRAEDPKAAKSDSVLAPWVLIGWGENYRKTALSAGRWMFARHLASREGE